MLWILEIDLENITGGWIRSDRTHVKVRSVFEIWCMAKVDTSSIHTDYSHCSTSSTTTISMDRMHVLIISVRDLLEFDWDRRVYRARWTWPYQCRWATRILHAYVSAWRPTWNMAMYNNARDRDSNLRCNYCGNFRKCRLITRHQFSSANHCTRRTFRWRITAIHSQRERNNRSRIRNRLSTKNNSCGDKRVSYNFSTHSMYSYGKTPFRVWEDRNPLR